MRMAFGLILVIFLSGCSVFAQEEFRITNLWVPDGAVAPGTTVLAQKIKIDTWNKLEAFPNYPRMWWGWENVFKALSCDDDCAYTQSYWNGVEIVFTSVSLPPNAVIRGIGVQVKGTSTADDWNERRLVLQLLARDVSVPYVRGLWLPQGGCGEEIWTEAGGPDDTWGWNWTPSDLQKLSVRLVAIMPLTCEEQTTSCPIFYVDCLKAIIYYALPTTKLEKIRIRNTADTANAIQGADIEKIEIVRASDGRVIGTLTDTTELAKINTSGAVVSISSAYQAFTSSTEIHVRIKLKPTVALGKQLILGDTRCTINSQEFQVNYFWGAYPPARFTVGPAPVCKFDETEMGKSVDIFSGQRFLVGRILIDARETPFDLTLQELLVRNGYYWPRLDGRYISSIEVRRASDGALLGQQTLTTELEKFATTEGTRVSLTTNNVLPAYGQIWLEVWITLKHDAPAGHKIRLENNFIKISGTYLAIENASPLYTIAEREEKPWLEVKNDEELKDGGAVPGQRFLAQRLILTDDDSDPYDVVLNSALIKNIGNPPLAEQHIALIELRRVDTGAVIGSTTNASGLSTTGVRIPLSATVSDDTTIKVEIWLTLRDTAPVTQPARKVKLSSQIWYTEGGVSEPTPSDGEEGPEFEVVGPGGLEEITKAITAPVDLRVYPGQTFLAHALKLQDNDLDPYDVILNRILIKNLSSSPQVLDQHVASIEVRDSSGKLLGRIQNISGLTTTGIWVPTTTNNTILDDKSLTIEIWITLKADVPAGRKLKLGAQVEHTEGGQTFVKPLDRFEDSGVEFTTATDGVRTVSFTYTPDKPKWSDEITFTPSVSPTTGVVYARWEFGDGRIVERRKAEGENPLDPIKHTYRKGGEFTVILAVRDESNREVRASKTILVTNEPPKNVAFTFTPASPMVNQPVTFTPAANVEDPDGDIKKAEFRWNFGDGSPEVTTTGPQNTTHTYTQAGTYTVTLTVTDEGGEKAEARASITVGTPTPPAPQTPTITGLTMTPLNPEAGKPTTFTATATAPANDPVLQWEWDFGDGTPSATTDANTVTHTYEDAGVYTVRVRARNSAGWSVPYTRTITVFPAGVTFGFLILDNPVTGNQCRIQIFAPAGATDVKLTILDMAGRPVLLDKPVSVGIFTWDLKDREGRPVPNGLYLFYVTARIEGQIRRTEIGRILVRR